MTDKPEPEEKTKPKAEPPEKQESKAQAPAPEKKAESKAEEKPKEQAEKKEHAEKKGKKISRMTLPEVEAGLKGVKEKMGGFESNFAQHLLARKKDLTQPAARS